MSVSRQRNERKRYIDKKIKKIISIIDERIKIKDWSKNLSPFELLVSTIISQNTASDGVIKAFNNLKGEFGKLTPRLLANVKMEKLKKLLKPAGLYNRKARIIKHISNLIHKMYSSNLNKILDMPQDKAREALLNFPGVGYKTADVLLNFVAGKGNFPIDTHIFRLSKILGISDIHDYESIRKYFENIVPLQKRKVLHLKLIGFGKSICKARAPKCDICPVNDLCKKT